MRVVMFNRLACVCALMLWVIGGVVMQAQAQERHDDPYAFLQQSVLTTVKQQLRQGTEKPQTRLAYTELIAQAEKALNKPNPSVTEKGMTPPSGSKHDYMSLSVYWWPDSNKSNGLPWVRRDGVINPVSKSDDIDGVRLEDFTDQVYTLTLAWYFSDNAAYADKAISLIRTWFIDPETRMNPNLDFAQGVPGIAPGRGAGVLDGRYFSTRIVDALIMLRGYQGWQKEDDTQMREWMTSYLEWLQTSKLAKRESEAKNNHGSWYAAQVAGIAWYLGKKDIVAAMAALQRTKLNHQIQDDGAQPEELSRTRSFHYSYFNLQAITNMAVLADKVGEDLWRYRTPQGSGIANAFNFLAPYLDKDNRWPYKSFDQKSARLIPLMLRVDEAKGNTRYRNRIEKAGFSTFLSGMTRDKQDVGGEIGQETRRDVWLLSSLASAPGA